MGNCPITATFGTIVSLKRGYCGDIVAIYPPYELAYSQNRRGAKDLALSCVQFDNTAFKSSGFVPETNLDLNNGHYPRLTCPRRYETPSPELCTKLR